MRILLVEDDVDLGPAIAKALRSENCVVDLVTDGIDAEHLGDTETYDAAVLDLGLPRRDGVSVLRAWRDAGHALPVLILTARDGWSDKVAGFKAGADDFLTKPFRIEELMMRLRAIVRRAAGHAATTITCGPLSYDSQSGRFERDGFPLRLTGLEWRVLSTLMLSRDTVIERSALIERVYEMNADGDSNSLEVIIGRLRRKVGAELIETVRGRGYRLTAENFPGNRQ